MSSDAVEITHLEALPTEILQAIVDLLPLKDIKGVSCSNKRLRQACVPPLFRCVKFEFSLAGIEALERLLVSDIPRHIITFTYEVPELLKTEILDFDRFKSDVLNPDSYVDLEKELYDADGDEHECRSYIAIYNDVYGICREQRTIIDDGADLVLSSIFAALPLLKEVRLCFFRALEGCSWVLQSLSWDMVMEDELYHHHLQVVTKAIQSARSKRIAIHTFSLWYFEFPWYYPLDLPTVSSLSDSLRQLLEHIKVLRLRGSKCVLKLLSHCALDLHQLDMCRMPISDTALADFLRTNKRTIQSIGFHDVTIWTTKQLLKSSLPMTRRTLCSVLTIPQCTPCWADDCGCIPWKKEGSRLLLRQDRIRRPIAKRKFDDL